MKLKNEAHLPLLWIMVNLEYVLVIEIVYRIGLSLDGSVLGLQALVFGKGAAMTFLRQVSNIQ